ncbi:hypothetical protein Peur_016790 [Populus x canadensis]
MAASRRFVPWLHGLGDSGPANVLIKTLFTCPEFRTTKWSFPSAPISPVSCNDSPKYESGSLKAVRNVHAIIDKEIAAGTNPENVFVCGFSQGGALTLTSVLLYPKTLGGGAVFSGWVPFNSSIMEQISADAKRVLPAINTSAIKSQSWKMLIPQNSILIWFPLLSSYFCDRNIIFLSSYCQLP